MCCVLQGAERVFPSVGNGGKHGTGTGSGKGAGDTPVGAQDLPLESLWAAGLDEGMGFPQRCSYANQHTLAASSSTSHTSPSNPDEFWRERNLPHRYILQFMKLINQVFKFSLFLLTFLLLRRGELD